MACESSPGKTERGENQVMKSDRNVDMTESEVLAEVQIFRLKTANDIKANFRKIAAIKGTIKTGEESERGSFEDKLEILDKANREMKRTIDNFTESGRVQWVVFQDEFSDSMDSLSNSLDNFFAGLSTDSVQ